MASRLRLKLPGTAFAEVENDMKAEYQCEREAAADLCVTYGSMCDENADCETTADWFQCVCHEGYTGNGKVNLYFEKFV